MPKKFEHAFTATKFRTELDGHNHDLGLLPGWMFEGLLLYIVESEQGTLKGTSSSEHETLDGRDFRMKQAYNTAKFASARFTKNLGDDGITHIVVGTDGTPSALREKISRYVTHPYFTTLSLENIADKSGKA